MPGISYYWLSNQQIEPLSAVDIAMSVVLAVSLVIGIAISVWYAVKEL